MLSNKISLDRIQISVEEEGVVIRHPERCERVLHLNLDQRYFFVTYSLDRVVLEFPRGEAHCYLRKVSVAGLPSIGPVEILSDEIVFVKTLKARAGKDLSLPGWGALLDSAVETYRVLVEKHEAKKTAGTRRK